MTASEAVRVSCFPSRCTVIVTGLPAGWWRRALPIWVQLRTGTPATAMILSPARTPARLAGEAGFDGLQAAVRLDGTQVSMAPTVVEVPGVARAIEIAIGNSSTKACAKCIE